MRGDRGRGRGSRGRGRGSRGSPASFGTSSFALDYSRVEDFERDPLDAFAPSNRSSGRGQARSNDASRSARFHGGLGFASSTLRDISNTAGSRALLQPIKFVRGKEQELLASDRDDVLIKPGVHDERERTRTESSSKSEPKDFVVDTSGDQSLVDSIRITRGNDFLAAASEDSSDDEEIVYVPPSNIAESSPTQPGSSVHIELAPLRVAVTDSLPAPAAEAEDFIATPAIQPGKSATASRKAAKKAAKASKRQKGRSQPAGAPREGDSDLEWGSDGPPVDSSSAIDALSNNLKARVLADVDEDNDMQVDSDLEDSSFAVSFVKSMAANIHVSTDDIAIEKALQEVEEHGAPWETDPDGSSASDAESIIQRVEDERWNDEGSDSDSDDSSISSDEAQEAIEAEEDEVDDDDLLVGGWDQADAILDAHPELLQKGNRAERNKLFRAIERGDFSGFVEDDDFALQPVKKKKGTGKATFALPGIDSDDEFMISLQQQWQADRASKATRKKARAAARAETGPSKAQRKKAKRRTGDEADALPEHNLLLMHERIRTFAMDIAAGPSLGLPPATKRQRVAVHLLAEAYGLASRSVGKGANRAPILQRTARTAVHGVPQRKIHSIINAAEGKVTHIDSGYVRGRTNGLWRVLDGSQDKARSSPIAKNREGAIVGHGAEALDEGNVGFRLLSRMGWNAGEKIGVTGGLDVPLAATIKTSRRGLGH